MDEMPERVRMSKQIPKLSFPHLFIWITTRCGSALGRVFLLQGTWLRVLEEANFLGFSWFHLQSIWQWRWAITVLQCATLSLIPCPLLHSRAWVRYGGYIGKEGEARKWLHPFWCSISLTRFYWPLSIQSSLGRHHLYSPMAIKYKTYPSALSRPPTLYVPSLLISSKSFCC